MPKAMSCQNVPCYYNHGNLNIVFDSSKQVQPETLPRICALTAEEKKLRCPPPNGYVHALVMNTCRLLTMVVYICH